MIIKIKLFEYEVSTIPFKMLDCMFKVNEVQQTEVNKGLIN